MAVSVDDRCLRLTDDSGERGRSAGDAGARTVECAFSVRRRFANPARPRISRAIELASEGTLYSYTIVRVPPPGWPGPVPYVLGEVELPEGPHVLAEVVDCAHDDLKVGMPVALAICGQWAMGGVADSELGGVQVAASVRATRLPPQHRVRGRKDKGDL